MSGVTKAAVSLLNEVIPLVKALEPLGITLRDIQNFLDADYEPDEDELDEVIAASRGKVNRL